MDKYKINRNREPLTDADVQKGQDFDAFMKAYSGSPKPFYKTSTFKLTVVALGLVIGVGTYVALNSDGTNPAKNTAYVSPALPGIDIADTTYKMDAAEGGNFLYSTGSVIRVPEGAFLDSAGNVAKGNVEIRYREFHDPGDIFLAGIPMTYDSAGQRFHFESAGMLEITAWQNGKMLTANPASPIKVDMASNSDENKFNVYYLDTVKKNWNFIAKDKPLIVGFAKDSTKNDSVKSTASITVPLPPRKADKEKPSFSIKYDPTEFPELNAYKGTRFEVDESKTPYNKEDKKVKWEDVAIERNKDGATYTVTFTKGDLTSTYITYAVVDEKNYGDAKKDFDKRYAAYRSGLQKKETDEMASQRSTEKRLMNADAKRIFVNDTVLAGALSRFRSGGKNAGKEDMVMREFQIAGFGIWNSDCPASLPPGTPMYVRLIDTRTNTVMVVEHLYLVEKGRNAIFTFYAHDLEHFQFNPSADNMVWGVTMDGKLAMATGDDLKGMKEITVDDKKIKILPMTVQKETLANAVQAKVALGI